MHMPDGPPGVSMHALHDHCQKCLGRALEYGGLLYIVQQVSHRSQQGSLILLSNDRDPAQTQSRDS